MDVLIVDDEEAVGRLFLQRFRNEIKTGEYNLFFFTRADEALKNLINLDSNKLLVLSDIVMPGMNGLELLGKIRELNVTLPVYMVSALDNEEYRSKSMDLGATGFLTKPLDFNLLKQLLREHWNGSNSGRG